MQDQTIIGLSGKKQSGKNTAMNFILGIHLRALNIIKGKFDQNERGELLVNDMFGDESQAGIFDINMGTPEMEAFLKEAVDPYFKVYSFADLLKQEVCMKILGLTYEQCYGTDQEKNSLTHLKWEDMPGITCEMTPQNTVNLQGAEAIRLYYEKVLSGIIYHTPGYMTAREVMQYVGTNIFRKMYGNVWVDALMRRIKEEGSATAIIYDCRFPNEVEGIQATGGFVIRLTRNPFNDTHESETALDPDKFDQSKFNAILDNANCSIHEQNVMLYNQLKAWNLLPIELEGF